MSGATQVWVVEERENPSTDNYIIPVLAATGRQAVRRGFDEVPSDADLDGSTIVFVRYVPPAWRSAVSRLRSRIARVVYFMDDDLWDFGVTGKLPIRYRWKLWHLATRQRRWLDQQAALLWVSTPVLAEKYRQHSPLVVPPSGVDEMRDVRRIFYHGSASHMAEVEWLGDVIRHVLDRAPHACFEVIGTEAVRRVFAGLPRVTVVHPMGWPAYQTFSAVTTRHIGLAPMLPSEFNRARSHTRFLDHTRMGAVGVYAEGSANAALVTHLHDGIVVPMQKRAWSDAILALLNDDDLRTAMATNAGTTALMLKQKARAAYLEARLWGGSGGASPAAAVSHGARLQN